MNNGNKETPCESDELSILKGFNQYFEMIPAFSQELKEEVYKLRYQIYCLETGFENPDEFENEMEIDDNDERSVHYLIRHKSSNTFVATTRLILPDINNVNRMFPVEEHCTIENQQMLSNVPRHHIAEASRFCVSKNFKRRKSDANTLAGIGKDTYDASFSDDERGTFPHISLALFACLIEMSRNHGITYWYVVMEPALYRFFDRLGVHFHPIGPLVDYHGKRKPGAASVSEMLEGTRQKNIKVWNMFTNNGNYWS